MIQALLFWVCVVFCAGLALAIHFAFINPPGRDKMNINEQYATSARNLLINVSFFSLFAIVIGLIFNLINVFLGGEKFEGKFFDAMILLAAIILWQLWPLKTVKLDTKDKKGNPEMLTFRFMVTPPNNSVMRTRNRIYNPSRNLPLRQGKVDNTIKWSSEGIAILHFLNKLEGFIQTESKPSIEIKIDQLRFKNDIGSCSVVIAWAALDADAYPANGDDEATRLIKVRTTVVAKIKAMIEAETSTMDVLKAMGEATKISRKLTNYFLIKLRRIEAKLGIRIQFIEITDINESEAYRQTLSNIGATKERMRQAKQLVKASEKSPKPLTLEMALKYVTGWSQDSEMSLGIWTIDASGLENLHDINLGGLNPQTLAQFAQKQPPGASGPKGKRAPSKRKKGGGKI